MLNTAKRYKYSLHFPNFATVRSDGTLGGRVHKEIRLPSKQATSAYRRLTHPTSLPIRKLFSNTFPLSVKESLHDFACRHNVFKFQSDLLSVLPFYPEQDDLGRTSRVVRTMLDCGNYINEFVIYPKGASENSKDLNHLIMVHGYGSGLGLYIKNFEQISRSKNWCIHAIDLLGYGCSSRPPFRPETRDLNGVEKWFHDSFEEWLVKRNLGSVSREKILVVAHSMGAYLMASYIMKKKNFCKKLIMASPGAIIKHRKQIFVPGYFAKLWEQNISPFSLIRNAGPLGSKLVSGWTSRRFAKLHPSERKLMHKYIYGIFQSPGSGEYMLNYLLAPGADARSPLIERGVHKINCELLWCYGKEDWMDKKGGELCSNIINNYHRDPKRSTVVEIPDSGHHLYLDNYKRFNDLLIHEMQKYK